MTLDIELLKDNRVILCKYSDPINIEREAAILALQRPFYDKATAPIHRIVDITEIHEIPPHLLSAVLHRTNLHHQKSGAIVVIVHHAFLSILAEIVTRAIPSTKITIVKSMREALQEIDRILAQEQQPATTE